MRILFVCLIFFCGTAMAQPIDNPGKGHLFNSLPDTIYCPILQLEKVFNTSINGVVTFNFSTTLTGVVKHRFNPQSDMNKATVRLTGLGGAIFTVAKIFVGTDFMRYAGSIGHQNYADAYALRFIGTHYYLIKYREALQEDLPPPNK